MWKDFFYFSKKERIGILVLVIFILGIFIGKQFFSGEVTNSTIISHSDSILPPPLPKKENPDLQEIKTKKLSSPKKTGYSNQSYNPKNTFDADKTSKQQLYSDRNIQKSSYEKVEKYKPGMKVNIQQTDTSGLKKIPGIGSALSNRIVKYRELLGGFYSVEQIKEVYGISEEQFQSISAWMTIANDSLTRIPVNRSSLEKLKSHPYLNFYQAKAIIDLRKKRGKLSDIHELELLEEFSETDLYRLKFYLNFDQ